MTLRRRTDLTSLSIRAFAFLGLCFVASAAYAGTVTGTVMNGTTGKPAAGVDMILIQLQGTMQPVANTKTDATGHYQFDNPSLGTGPMLIRAVYHGVTYHEPAVPGKTVVNVQVFEPTDKASAFAVTVHFIVVQPTGSDLTVNESYIVSNKTSPPLAYFRPDGSFLFPIPQGAQEMNASAVTPNGMPVIQALTDKGNGQQAITFPFRPGETRVDLTYKIPYPGNQETFHFSSPYATDRLAILAPPSVQISGDGFSPAGQEQGYSVYLRQSVAARTPISVSISGTAPPPVAQDNTNSGNSADNSGGDVPGGGTTDDTQNPSVNSHADSDSSAPVATVTSFPARLDSLRWIVVGGFVALFALGLIYVWRQPQTATAGVAQRTENVPLPVAPAPRRAASAQSSAPPDSVPEKAAASNSDVAASANLDREVRGSLDELKDSLFRLELRREAGTITEDAYVSERDRVQKVLRDLVKG